MVFLVNDPTFECDFQQFLEGFIGPDRVAQLPFSFIDPVGPKERSEVNRTHCFLPRFTPSLADSYQGLGFSGSIKSVQIRTTFWRVMIGTSNAGLLSPRSAFRMLGMTKKVSP